MPSCATTRPSTGWTADGDGVRVTTSRGSYDAGALVLAPGRWTVELLGGLDLPLVVERRVQHWFAPPSLAPFLPGRLPVWIWDRDDGTSLVRRAVAGRHR